MRKMICLALLALHITTPAQAILIDERTPDTAYKAAADTQEATAQIMVITNTRGATSSGTGVLIGKNLVLTAAHVVEKMCTTGIVRFASNDGTKEQISRITSFYIHPGYEKGKKGGEVDLAILVLETPITVVTSLPLNLSPAQADMALMTCTGYGKTGTLASGINEGHYRQLARETKPIVQEMQRYLKSGLMCSQEEKMQTLTHDLKELCRKSFKRLAVVPVQKWVESSGVAYYVMHAPAGEVPAQLPHPLYGAPRPGDRGAGLLNASGEVVGILNHILNDARICWLDLAPHKTWIESVMRNHPL